MRKDLKTLKEQKHKELKALYRKLDNLWDSIRRLPKVKLDKPRWVGYKRYFILRDDIARRKDAKDFLEILNLLNNTVYSKTKEGFSRFDIDDPKLHYHKQRIKTLSEKQFKDLKEPYKKYFVRVNHWDFRKKEVRYEFIYPWFFIMKVKHHYLTEVPMLDKEMESEIDKLENKFNRDNLWPKIGKLMGWSRYRTGWEYDWNETKKRLMDILIKSEMYNYWKEE